MMWNLPKDLAGDIPLIGGKPEGGLSGKIVGHIEDLADFPAELPTIEGFELVPPWALIMVEPVAEVSEGGLVIVHSEFDEHTAPGVGWVVYAPQEYYYLKPDQVGVLKGLRYEDIQHKWKCEIKRGDRILFRRFLRSAQHEDNHPFEKVPQLAAIMEKFPQYELCLLHPKDALALLEDDDHAA